uniref:acyl carrier protein n=1 Tax=Sinomicrobium pectinilyticum TaxID=1084421 RepID=UPI003743AB3E
MFAGITGIPADSIQPDARLTDLGLDSLMSVELSIALQSKLGLDTSMMEIMGAGTINKLVQLIKKKVSRLHLTAVPAGSVEQTKTATAKNLINDYLMRICVGKPYFSLTEINRSSDGLTAVVEGFYWNRNIPLNMADSARHLALLGSCAVADVNPDNSRHCYPVQHGDLSIIRIPRPDEKLTLYAKPFGFDYVKSHCKAIALIRDNKGETCMEMEVSYHIIPEKVLYTLFEQHINTNPAWQDINSEVYEDDNPAIPEINDDGRICFRIDKLQPEQCVGHFSNLPAFPVSIMTRYAAHLIEVGRKLAYKDKVFKPERVTCETDNFAFAGESVLFTAYENGRNGRSFHWTCEIETPDRKIARLDLYETALPDNRKV